MSKIIFTSGYSHTGTTLMGLILANTYNGIALGEIYSLFGQHRDKYISLIPEINILPWSEAKDKTGLEFYFYILSKYQVITDSSKTISWIRKIFNQFKKSHKIYHVVLYKEPLLAYQSSWARGHSFDKFATTYLSYYKKYKNEFNNLIWVKWEDFLASPSKITNSLCKKLGLKYSRSKIKPWKNDKLVQVLGSHMSRKTLNNEISQKIHKNTVILPNFPLSKAIKQVNSINWSSVGPSKRIP